MKKVLFPSEMIILTKQMLKYPKASNHTLLKHLRLTKYNLLLRILEVIFHTEDQKGLHGITNMFNCLIVSTLQILTYNSVQTGHSTYVKIGTFKVGTLSNGRAGN